MTRAPIFEYRISEVEKKSGNFFNVQRQYIGDSFTKFIGFKQWHSMCPSFNKLKNAEATLIKLKEYDNRKIKLYLTTTKSGKEAILV
jgi:hypothetical protein